VALQGVSDVILKRSATAGECASTVASNVALSIKAQTPTYHSIFSKTRLLQYYLCARTRGVDHCRRPVSSCLGPED
jgi:hypothetical protein